MALPFANPVSQCMPGFGSPSYYGSATSGTSNTSAVTIIIGNTATTPSTGGTGFNVSGGPTPTSGKWHLRLVGATSTTALSLAVQVTDGNTLWTVQEVVKTGERFIGCYLMQGREGSRDGWGYKPMEESMGPCETTCPPCFFDMVPCPEGYAVEWRKRVLADHARRNQKLRVNDHVRLTNGKEYLVTSVRPLRGKEVGQMYSPTYHLPRNMLTMKAKAVAA